MNYGGITAIAANERRGISGHDELQIAPERDGRKPDGFRNAERTPRRAVGLDRSERSFLRSSAGFSGLALGSVVVFLYACAAYAAPAGLDTNSPALLSSNSTADLFEVVLRMVGALMIVFALFGGGVWFFKRTRLFTLYQRSSNQLCVIESRNIGYRNSLVVVAYHRQRFLLSVSATGVNLVTALPDAASDADDPASIPAASSFAEQLTALVRKG